MNTKLLEARKAFGKLLSHKQDVLATFEGTLGDGAGNVQVTSSGRENFVYVRIHDTVHEVFNSRVPLHEGLKVMVGYEPSQPDLLQILGTRSTTPFGDTGRLVTTYPPSDYYAWLGVDPLFIDKRLWLPRRVSLISPLDPEYNAMSVRIYNDMVWLGDSWFQLVDQVVDLSSYVPVTEDKETIVLITVNDSGAIACVAGSPVDIGSMTAANVPSVPSGTIDVLAAVHMYYGQTSLVESLTATDILDLRYTYFSGSGSGGGHIIQDAGTPLTQRANLNFTGFTVSDDAGNDATNITNTPTPVSGGFPSWFVEGTLATGANVGMTFVAPFVGTIVGVTIHLKTKGSAGSTIVDILVNGATIFNPTTPPTVAYNAANNYITVVPDVTALAVNDVVTMAITQVATGAADLSVTVNGATPVTVDTVLQQQVFS